ncbi:hypothetical protein LY76DRAFT_36449 [Colletotrichum caudatum]|nr:hypothetical protein LY76DRAFT_36449 [Colletotrichum caudatum]
MSVAACPRSGHLNNLDSPAPAPLDRGLAWAETRARGPESRRGQNSRPEEIERRSVCVCHLQTSARAPGALTPLRTRFSCKRRLPSVAGDCCLPGAADACPVTLMASRRRLARVEKGAGWAILGGGGYDRQRCSTIPNRLGYLLVCPYVDGRVPVVEAAWSKPIRLASGPGSMARAVHGA